MTQVFAKTYNNDKLAFSYIKAWLRANRDRVNMELQSENGRVYNAFRKAVNSITASVTAENVKGWYSHCGYHAPL